MDTGKKSLRRAMLDKRAHAAREIDQASEAACALIVASVPIPSGAVVSGYWAMRDEIDSRPALESLHGAGHRIGLPVVEGANRPLKFRLWAPGDALVSAAFGTLVPGPDAPTVVPSVGASGRLSLWPLKPLGSCPCWNPGSSTMAPKRFKWQRESKILLRGWNAPN